MNLSDADNAALLDEALRSPEPIPALLRTLEATALARTPAEGPSPPHDLTLLYAHLIFCFIAQGAASTIAGGTPGTPEHSTALDLFEWTTQMLDLLGEYASEWDISDAHARLQQHLHDQTRPHP